MKWIRIILLHFERVLEYRLRSFVWILIPATNNLTLILFWVSAQFQNKTQSSVSQLATYYFLMTVTSVLLTSHVEFEMSEYLIKQGDLVNYLLKPISFYYYTIIEELPYRVVQGIYAVVLILVFALFFPGLFKFDFEVIYLPLIILIFVMGYLLSLTFKMCVAYVSFWSTEIRSVQELADIFIIILSGGILPLSMYPTLLQKICSFLPFDTSISKVSNLGFP